MGGGRPSAPIPSSDDRGKPLRAFAVGLAHGTAGTGGGAQGVALSPDGGLLLMVARPVRPAADIVFGEQLMEEIFMGSGR